MTRAVGRGMSSSGAQTCLIASDSLQVEPALCAAQTPLNRTPTRFGLRSNLWVVVPILGVGATVSGVGTWSPTPSHGGSRRSPHLGRALLGLARLVATDLGPRGGGSR